MDLASRIDHTLLKPNCLEKDIVKLCKEAINFNFHSVCIPPFYLNVAKPILHKTNVNLCTVIGFPFGYETLNTKLKSGEEALNAGAEEIDMVINLSAFKSGKIQYVYLEVERLAELCIQNRALLKVIIETAYLNKDEMRMITGICADAGANFIKTSTGYAEKGATIEDVAFLREIVPANIKIKAAGGIKTFEDAVKLINSGADRLGTSNGINIINTGQTVPVDDNARSNY